MVYSDLMKGVPTSSELIKAELMKGLKKPTSSELMKAELMKGLNVTTYSELMKGLPTFNEWT